MIGNGVNWKDVGGGIMGYVIPENQQFSVLYINNLTNEESIVHAHGQTPPSTLDGVPYLSSVPIFPGRSQYYEYNIDPIANQGTYFLHSHYGFQFGNGLVAPLIIQGSNPSYPLYPLINEAQDIVMFLEDLCPHASEDYEKKLQKAKENGLLIPRMDINNNLDSPLGDCSSWSTYLKLAYDFEQGSDDYDNFSCSNLIPATDSDVLYQKYLANGYTYNSPNIITNIDFSVPIRYRVINAGGMTNFYLKFPFNVTLITTDGQWIQPYTNNTFWISVSQRLDFLIEIPSNFKDNYLYITAWSESYTSSIPAPLVLSKLDLNKHEKYSIQQTLRNIYKQQTTYATGMMNNDIEYYINAFTPLENKTPDNTQIIHLTGDNGFRGINHYSYRLPPTGPLPFKPNPYPILVEYGQRVELQIRNENADGHPMHLHGHQFQIVNLNGQQVNGAIRDVAFVPGGCQNVTIQFDALNPGIWAFHCHLEFHLAAGMLTTVEYSP